MSEKTAGRAEGPLDARERLIQSQLPSAPRITTERMTQRIGLAEKLTSACMSPSVVRRGRYVKAPWTMQRTSEPGI
jgi:hypothetical protein